jgi:hypothetical protein
LSGLWGDLNAFIWKIKFIELKLSGNKIFVNEICILINSNKRAKELLKYIKTA